MAQGGTVVDELVVKLRLDADAYKKADKEVDQVVSKTEKKRIQEDDKSKKRETASIKRTKEATSATKTFGVALRGLAVGIAGVLGIGSAAGIVTAVVALSGMETNLRRAAVSTNMSNREMQAWGATAKRLGADAQAGAAAIADLAKEQQQFNITGQAPTMMALARLGIRATPDTSIADMLAQAQQVYRGSSPAQQKQIEAGLSAQGVSNDLIVMIKSETDAREAYTKSFAEAATENRKALDAVTDSLASLSASAVNIANTIATIAQPGIEAFTKWVSESAISLSKFNDRVIASGGGLDGFIKVAGEDFPKTTMELLRSFRVMGEAIDVVAYGLDNLWKALQASWSWLTGRNGREMDAAKDKLKPALQGAWWDELVKKARANGPAPIGAPTAPPAAGKTATTTGTTTAQELMTKLVTGHGLTVPQAAGVVANIDAESKFDPAAFNAAGGGTGARGLLQWRGARSAAFQKKYGIMPNQATIDQQLEFMFNDPYERGLLNRSMGAGKNGSDIGEAFSTIFEAHGNAAETSRRGREAARLANAYQAPAAGTPGAPTISINTVTVQANNPAEFVGSIQRVTGPQNYNSGVR